MKKIFVMFAMLTMALAANAQFEKGNTYVGASLTNLDMNYKGSGGFSVGANALVGAFLCDNVLLYGQAGYQHVGKPEVRNAANIGIGARYYIVQNGLFLDGKVDYQHATGKFNDVKPGLAIGYAFFVSKEMTIEPALYYEQSTKNHSDYSTVGFKIGIGLYHAKDKIKETVKDVLDTIKE